MAKNHFYWGIKKTVAMPQNAWTQLIATLEGTPDILDIDGNLVTQGTPPYLQGTVDQRFNTFQIRHNQNVPFDGVIYEANFDDANLSLEIIRRKLVQASGLADSAITFTTSQQTFLTRPSGIVAYRANGTIMFRATIFGRLNDTQTVTWAQSLAECIAFLIANTLEWDGTSG